MTSSIRDILASPSFRRASLDVAAGLLAVACGVAVFAGFAHGDVVVGPARLTVSAEPAMRPLTVVELPPFGSVEAPTHAGPVTIRVLLRELDVARATRMIESGEVALPMALDAEAARGLPISTASLWRSLAVGFTFAVAAGALVALAMRRRLWVVGVAAACAALVPAIAIGAVAATWDVAAFREPTLRGSLTYAPQLVDVFSTRVADIGQLRDQAAKVAEDLSAYYADDRSLDTGGPLPGTHRVLHVTDLHLDPVGAQLASSIARSYEASLVVDTGDLPILGAEVEARAFASLVDTSVPRVYVPGNHDSPASVAELRRLGVTVVESGTVTIDGIAIYGVPDPISRGFGVEPDVGKVNDIARAAFARLESALASGEATPQIVAIHNPQMELPFVGTVPLILSGHTHSVRLYDSKGTVRLNSGTLGGMPYDPEASNRKPLPYSASVLYFTAEEPRRLIALDRIAVYPTRSTTVSRDVIDESLLP